MKQKLKRLSYNQLLVLRSFLRHAGRVVTVRQLEKETPLSGKSLGGVLSSLSRTRFRNISLIEPAGASVDRVGLRWWLNTQLIDVAAAAAETDRLLGMYRS